MEGYAIRTYTWPSNGSCEHFLICDICCEEYELAKILPCLHCFCGPCLSKTVTRDRALECLICQSMYAVSDNDFTGVVKNLYDLVAEFAWPSGKYFNDDYELEKCAECTKIDDTVTSKTCIDCNVTLCTSCVKKHGVGLRKRAHRVVPRYEELKPKGVNRGSCLSQTFTDINEGLSSDVMLLTAERSEGRNCIHVTPRHQRKRHESVEKNTVQLGTDSEKALQQHKGYNLVRILLVGDPHVGKSALINKYTNNSPSTSRGFAIGVEFAFKVINVDDAVVKLHMWDIAAAARFGRVAGIYLNGTNGCVLVYDVTNPVSFESLGSWISICQDQSKCQEFVVIGNKADLTQTRKVPKEIAEDWCEQRNIPYFEMSAECDSEGDLELAFLTIAKKALPHI